MTGRTAGIAAMSGLVLALTSCGDAPGDSGVAADGSLSEAVDIDALYENRTEYLGDNSRVAALVDAVGVEDVGEPAIELETESEPLALIVTLSPVSDEVVAEPDDDLLNDRSVLLLATIANADEIRWSFQDDLGDERSESLTRTEADDLIGSSVRDMSDTPEKLEQLVDQLEDA